MMLPSFRIGTLLGFPIRVNLTFLVLLGVVFLWMGGTSGLLVALLAFGSVLLHELGHAVMARRLGVRVASIELHFFGGAAKMADLPPSPGHEIAIAAAGPAVSFALAGFGHALAAMTGLHGMAIFGWVNLLLGAFNLVPAFPTDGGRILRALLARRRGLLGATDLAVKVGRVLCVALGVLGLWAGIYHLILIAVVLWMMGSAERLAVRLRGEREGWRAPAAAAEVVYIPPEEARRYGAPWTRVPPTASSSQEGPGAPRPKRVVMVWRI
jgi:Zn-dependent protease